MSANAGISDLIASELSQAAYPRSAAPLGWIANSAYSYANSTLFGTNSFTTFINAATKQIVVAFKGSDTLSNWVSDLANDGGSAWESISSHFRDMLSAIEADQNLTGYQIMTDGHSLGGGMAQTAALEFGLSGYGQNSLPVSNTAIMTDSAITDLGGFTNTLAIWRLAGNTFRELNEDGDPATLYYSSNRSLNYISTATILLDNPYVALEVAGVVDKSPTLIAIGAYETHSIGTVVQSELNGAETDVSDAIDTFLGSNNATVDAAITADPLAFSSSGAITASGSSGQVFSASLIYAGANTDTYAVNLNNQQNQTVVVSSDGSEITINTEIDPGATVDVPDIDSTTDVTQVFAFMGSSGTLKIDNANPNGAISNLGFGDTIDFTGILQGSATIGVESGISGPVLMVDGGNGSARVPLIGGDVAQGFASVKPDGGDGTDVSLQPGTSIKLSGAVYDYNYSSFNNVNTPSFEGSIVFSFLFDGNDGDATYGTSYFLNADFSKSILYSTTIDAKNMSVSFAGTAYYSPYGYIGMTYYPDRNLNAIKIYIGGAIISATILGSETSPSSLANDLTYHAQQISIAPQTDGPINIVEDYNVDQSIACYCQGTRILTAGGEVPVEALAIGDLLVTASGAHRPVTWLGYRRLDLRNHPDPQAVRPVCVSDGAFGEGLPARDLWLSPGHNIAFKGALIPISALLNGISVVQVECDHVEYWHVELDRHDIILAEGLPAESYLDTGNRTGFANGGAFIEAHPDFAPKHWAETCLPLVMEGSEVTRAKTVLLDRLKALGHDTYAAHDLHIVADGGRIEPIKLGERRFAFALAAGCRRIALASRSFVPSHTMADSTDNRELGVCVKRLQLDGVEIDLRGDLADGWHGPEQQPTHVQRWTTGMTALPSGTRLVVLDLAGDGIYWVERRDNVVALFG